MPGKDFALLNSYKHAGYSMSIQNKTKKNYSPWSQRMLYDIFSLKCCFVAELYILKYQLNRLLKSTTIINVHVHKPYIFSEMFTPC